MNFFFEWENTCESFVFRLRAVFVNIKAALQKVSLALISDRLAVNCVSIDTFNQIFKLVGGQATRLLKLDSENFAEWIQQLEMFSLRYEDVSIKSFSVDNTETAEYTDRNLCGSTTKSCSRSNAF